MRGLSRAGWPPWPSQPGSPGPPATRRVSPQSCAHEAAGAQWVLRPSLHPCPTVAERGSVSFLYRVSPYQLSLDPWTRSLELWQRAILCLRASAQPALRTVIRAALPVLCSPPDTDFPVLLVFARAFPGT